MPNFFLSLPPSPTTFLIFFATTYGCFYKNKLSHCFYLQNSSAVIARGHQFILFIKRKHEKKKKKGLKKKGNKRKEKEKEKKKEKKGIKKKEAEEITSAI